MRGRGIVPLVIVLLAIACAGSIYFVYSELSRWGKPFSRAVANPEEKAPAPSPPAPAPPPTSAPPETEPEPPATPPAVAPEPPGNPPKPPAPEPTPEVSPEELAAYADLVLEVLASRDEVPPPIDVIVSDEAGYAIEDALVVFRSGGTIVGRARADRAGRARLVLAAGDPVPVRVDAIARGYVGNHSDAVQPGATAEIALRARPVIEGEVRAPAPSQAAVTLYLGDLVYRTSADADGHFLFDELDEGPATVMAEVPAYGADSESFYLEAGTRRVLRFNIRPDRRIPIHGEVRFWPGKGSAWINGVPVAVNATGTFEFDRAVSGTNDMAIDAPGKALFREQFQVGGKASGTLHFILRDSESIAGRVRSARTGQPVRDAIVRVGVDFRDPANTRAPLFPVERVPVVRTDADGRFEIERLDNRLTYLVSIVAQGYGQFLGSTNPGRGLFLASLPEGPFLYGKLRGLGGVPEGAVVTALRIVDHDDGKRFNVPAWDASRAGRDREGFYGLSGLMPGTYLVKVHAAGYGTVETVVELGADQRMRIDLRLRRGEDADQEEAELLSRLPAAVDSDEEGYPADSPILFVDAHRPPGEVEPPGVRVRFFSGDLEFAAPLELSVLDFPLRGLPEGEYRAILSHPSFKKPLVKERILLKRGEPYHLEWK